MTRSEEDKITRKPITVKFGDQDYQIKPLPILKARQWRETLAKSLTGLGLEFEVLNSPNDMLNCLLGSLITAPDKIAELIFAYAPDLPPNTILETATEEQVAAAFAGVMRIAFPFVEALNLAMDISKPMNRPASAKSMN